MQQPLLTEEQQNTVLVNQQPPQQQPEMIVIPQQLEVLQERPMHLTVPIQAEMDDGDEALIGLSSKRTRMAFVRKVYLIVAYMISIVSAIVILACSVREIPQALLSAWGILLIDAFIGIVCGVTLTCDKKVARCVPLNYILLTIYSASIGILIAPIGAIPDKSVVIAAAAATICVVVGLTIYAWVAMTDFTEGGALLFCLVFQSIISGIALLRYPRHLDEIVISFFAAIAYSVYLIIDTELLIGNQGHMFSIDDYVFAALQIFADIMRIFLEILKILIEAKLNEK